MGKEGYVSIQAVNDMLEYCRNFDGNDAIYIFEKWFREQEPVQQKMGRWITWKEAGNDIPSETRFECSVCHDAAQTLCNGLDLLSTYCPNCGAKMQEVEE